MAVGVVSDFEGATFDQYDEILRLLGMSPRGKAEPGTLFHGLRRRIRGSGSQTCGSPAKRSRSSRKSGSARTRRRLASQSSRCHLPRGSPLSD